MQPLAASFYQRPVLRVAPDLLGCLLVRRIGTRTLIGRIVEVEAYREDDPASHSFQGRTERTEVMFTPGGRMYVYFTYGMHYCANVVTGPDGHGEAALLRAVEPLAGIEEMTRRRFGKKRLGGRMELMNLANGPAKLCQAFGIGRKENGCSLEGPELFITRDSELHRNRVGRSSRIGIRRGTEKRWRFFFLGNEWVSRKNFQ